MPACLPVSLQVAEGSAATATALPTYMELQQGLAEARTKAAEEAAAAAAVRRGRGGHGRGGGAVRGRMQYA